MPLDRPCKVGLITEQDKKPRHISMVVDQDYPVCLHQLLAEKTYEL